MRRVAKLIFIGIAGPILAACSDSGAQAQSAPVQDDQKTQAESQKNWLVDTSKSTLKFTGSMSGDEFEGVFKEFDASIWFDPDNLQNADIRVTIDMASFDAGDEERNEALPGKEWFFVKSFPKAEFVSDTVSKTGDDTYEAVGSLMIKDVTRQITLPFTLKIEEGIAKANGKVSINRTEFEVGTGMWKSEDWVAHNVEVRIKITATRL